mgnify:FL=1
MKSLFCSCLLLSATPLCAAQLPLPVEAPQPFRIGDSIEYDGQPMTLNCRRWQLKRLEANNVGVSQCEDKLYYYDTSNRNPIKASTAEGKLLVEFKPSPMSLSFPLFVGKKWSSRYSGYRADKNRRWDSRLDCEAKAYETMRVPAGTFDSIRIECIDHWEAGYIFSGQVRSTRWYAPAAGLVVKYRSDDSDWNYELASLKRQGSGASGSR